ncbi:hypothetical protein [Sinorhizobium meliloti]|nr:hypothetical protein [Sinorhizobium meliloti]CCM66778.1 hypothetical protein BN406_00733 [Sinorhizobium meliloti Rm41]
MIAALTKPLDRLVDGKHAVAPVAGVMRQPLEFAALKVTGRSDG